MFIAFDVLHANREATLRLPYRERRALLESLDLHGEHWDNCSSDTDGEALWRAVCALGLEGIFEKKRCVDCPLCTTSSPVNGSSPLPPSPNER